MKELLYSCLVMMGFASLFRRLKQRNKVTIILYHDISYENFEKHLITLNKYYHIIGLQDYFKLGRPKQPIGLAHFLDLRVSPKPSNLGHSNVI